MLSWVALLCVACGGGGGPAVAQCPTGTEVIDGRCQAPGPVVHVVVTLADQSRLLAPDPDLTFSGGKPAAINIDVDPATRYQSWVGVGGALTDSAAWVLQHDLTAAQRASLLADLFGPSGAGFGFLRISIGASDFSLSQYTLDDVPAGESDPALASFSIDPIRAEVLPTLDAIVAINPSLRIVASPWSAPAWMKTNQSLVHSPDPAVVGTLLPADYDVYAEYLTRFAEAMQDEGLPLYALTLQNEPAYEPADYPGMILDATARASLLSNSVGPRFRQRVPGVQLLEWDHNWDAPAEPLSVLGVATAGQYVGGVAWHCYAGDVSAQGQVHDAWPDKDAYITECSGGGWAPVWKDNFAWIISTLLIDGSRNWARGVLLWNLALDENSGPHTGGCTNCRGIVTVTSASGAVTRNEEYYALAHIGHFVRAGAERIDSSPVQDGVSNVAFRNADDGSVALLVVNLNATSRAFTVRQGGRTFAYTLAAGSAATFVWQPPS